MSPKGGGRHRKNISRSYVPICSFFISDVHLHSTTRRRSESAYIRQVNSFGDGDGLGEGDGLHEGDG